jgi:N-acyl-D-amino-acid deacylase
LDILFEHGTVVDGTGNPPYRAAVGIDRDRLVVIRGSTDHIEVGRRVDATSLVVAPGFIDVHSHSGLVLLARADHEDKVRQGVTTELIGVDGNSYAPFPNADELGRFVRLNAGLDGDPPIAYDWLSVREYLDRLDSGTGVNIVYVVGNSALRVSAIGWTRRRASRRALGRMRALLREALDEGAVGVSTGLDYPPGSYADTDELVELCREVAARGGIYHTHVRYQLGDGFLDPFREAIEICRRSGAALHVTHLYRRVSAPGGAQRLLDLIGEAQDQGIDVTFDTYPYEWSSTRLLILVPMWAHDGGPEQLKARLGSRALRPRLRREIRRRVESYGGEAAWSRIRIGNFKADANRIYEGWTLDRIIEDRGGDHVDVLCALLLEEDLALNQVAANPDAASLPRFFAHPLAMVGTDSVFLGERPSPRTFGSYPRILGDFVREERLVGLADAVRKMTSFPATRLGLSDRGLVRTGMKADLVVFDPATVRSQSTYETPRRAPVGIPFVLVNGQFVIDQSTPTGRRPGRVLRH